MFLFPVVRLLKRLYPILYDIFLQKVSLRTTFYSSQIAVAPQGTTPPVAETGRPISSQLVLPPKRGTSVVWSIYSMTAGDRPVV